MSGDVTTSRLRDHRGQTLSPAPTDIILSMKQLLLRVPDELHRALTLRAEREGRSVNALATEVLAAAASVNPDSRRDRLRLRATTLGILPVDDVYAASMSDAEHRAAIASMRGSGPRIDAILSEGRREG